jgi:hypothetical protein
LNAACVAGAEDYASGHVQFVEVPYSRGHHGGVIQFSYLQAANTQQFYLFGR